MNTPAHLVLGMAALSRPGAPGINVAILAGSLLPDLSLYLMGAHALYIQDIPPGIVFGQLYYSENWQRIFAIDNSVFVWAGVVLAGFWLRRGWLLALGLAGMLHLVLDFPLHHDDGRAHFWPLTNWVFESPISYWDPRHHGTIVGALEGLVCLALSIILVRRFKSIFSRAMILVLAATEIFPLLAPVLIFGSLS